MWLSSKTSDQKMVPQTRYVCAFVIYLYIYMRKQRVGSRAMCLGGGGEGGTETCSEPKADRLPENELLHK